MNPAGKYWSKIKSSDILELDTRKYPKNIGPIVDETFGVFICYTQASSKCALCYAFTSKICTALSCLEDPKLPAINQESMTLYIGFGSGLWRSWYW